MTTARRFRFAPTPSRELHVGNALAALFGWAMARAAGGRFILRIEDIDRVRSKPEHEAAILRDLAWLGVDWDEGPDVRGPHAPYRQSERLARYDALMAALAAAGLAYVCTCSRADIRAAMSAPHLLAGDELPYPGTCRARGERDPTRLPADRGGLRLDLAALAARGLPPIVAWHDGLLGAAREDVRTTAGDVLLGRPGQPTYQLAVVADDRAMAVSDVVRGVDLVGSTARQILLHGALASLEHAPAATPRFHHHPLIVDGDGRKLSKRDHAIAVASFADAAALRATVGRGIGLFGERVAAATTADWVEALAAAGRGPTLHDARWPISG